MATVFVTGATGVLGRAAIPQLLAAGHTVRALSRSAENDRAIHRLGAQPVRANLFDTGSLNSAMAGADAVMHLATRIPPTAQARRRKAWLENDRIRAEGTKHLVDGAIATGVRTLVYPSFAFVYPDSGDAWIDAATTPVSPASNLLSTIAAEAEVLRFAQSNTADGNPRRGIALRMGALYGPDVPSAVEMLDLAYRGISVIGAARDAYTPLLWIDDAAAALVTALDRAPSGTYDVVDDEPLRQDELVSVLAAAAGKRRLLSPPQRLLRVFGGAPAEALMRSLRVSNRRFREATGWAPTEPTARLGWARVSSSRQTPPTPQAPPVVRVGLLVMATFSLLIGVWQQFLPRSFYEDFPGLGRQWVSVDGPYNEHLLRDVGGAALAIGLMTLFAAIRPTVGLVRVVSAAFLVSQAPHFVYHAFHLDLLATPLDRFLQTGTLLVILLVPILVLSRASSSNLPSEAVPEPPRSDKEEPMRAERAGLIRDRRAVSPTP